MRRAKRAQLGSAEELPRVGGTPAVGKRRQREGGCLLDGERREVA